MSRREAHIVLRLDSPQMAQRVAKALEVETRDNPPYTHASVTAQGTELHVRVESEETRGLRAATNSYLRWADTAIQVARAAERSSESFKRGP